MKSYAILDGKMRIHPEGFYHRKGDVIDLKAKHDDEIQQYEDFMIDARNKLNEQEEIIISQNSIIEKMQRQYRILKRMKGA